MNFPNIIIDPCIPTTPPTVPIAPTNPACADPQYTLANPSICNNPVLILKPGIGLLCILGEVQLEAFLSQNGQEMPLTSGVVFSSSNSSIALVGASSGNATGVGAGTAVITATYATLGISATTSLIVMPGSSCCMSNEVSTVFLLDTSQSMGQQFGNAYSTKLDYAKAVAVQWANQTITIKDDVALITFNSTQTTVDNPTSAAGQVASDVGAQNWQAQSTSIGPALQAAVNLLAASDANTRTILLLSDGQNEDFATADDPLPVAKAFKNGGGIIICAGCRASGSGYNLLNAIATGGFFINAYPGIENASISEVMGLKGYICAGNCCTPGDTYEAVGALNYTGFKNWNVDFGTVDLIGNGFFDLLPGNGLYIDMAGSSPIFPGQITTKQSFTFQPNITYRLSFDLAGNQRANLPGYALVAQIVPMGNEVQINAAGMQVAQPSPTIFSQTVFVSDYTQPFTKYAFSFTVPVAVTGFICFTQLFTQGSADPDYGVLLDDVALDDTTDGINLFTDTFDGENIKYIPPACGLPSNAPLPGPGTTTVEQPLIPFMTGGTTPSGTASAGGAVDRSTFTASFAYTAFENTNFSFGGNFYTSQIFPFFQYQFPTAKTAAKYTVMNDLNTSSAPAAWTLQGSNNGLTFTTIDTRSGITWTGNAQTQTFTVASPGSYLYYKWNFTASVGAASGITDDIRLGSLQLLDGSNATLIPTMTSNTTPSGVASLGGNYTSLPQPSSQAYLLFTGADVSFGIPFYNADNPAFIQYQFSAATAIDQYSVTSPLSGSASFFPASWTLAGSNDGVTYTAIDVRSGITWTGTGQTQTFAVSANYAYYQWQFSLSEVGPGNVAGAPANVDQINVSHLQVYKKQTISSPGYGPAVSYIGYCCYGTGCLSSPPGPQLPDPNPLPDIEAGGTTTTTTYSSTKSYTAFCPQGTSQVSPTSLVPVMTSPTAPSGSVTDNCEITGFEGWRAFGTGPAWHCNIAPRGSATLSYTFPAPQQVIAFQITFDQLPNDPNMIVNIIGSGGGLLTNPLFTAFQISTLGLQVGVPAFFKLTSYIGAYQTYQLNFEAINGGLIGVSNLEYLNVGTGNGVTATATATSTISQAHADSKASLAAQSQATTELECLTQYTSTETYTANCPVGSFGQPVTQSATATSVVSQSAADSTAQANAIAAAQALLSCSGSNNGSSITIVDTPTTGTVQPSSPYGTVQYVQGAPTTWSRIVIIINGLQHTSLSDVEMVLLSPGGVLLGLMFDVGQGGGTGVNQPSVNFTFDSSASSHLPYNATITNGGAYLPTAYAAGNNTPLGAIPLSMAAPCPAGPYSTPFNTLLGALTNGSWALFCGDSVTLDSGSMVSWSITIT